MEDIVYDCTGHYNESSKGCERSTGRQCEVEIWTCTSIGWLALICIYGLNDSITNLFDWMTLCWPSGGPLSWGQTNKYEGIFLHVKRKHFYIFNISSAASYGGLGACPHQYTIFQVMIKYIWQYLYHRRQKKEQIKSNFVMSHCSSFFFFHSVSKRKMRLAMTRPTPNPRGVGTFTTGTVTVTVTVTVRLYIPPLPQITPAPMSNALGIVMDNQAPG